MTSSLFLKFLKRSFLFLHQNTENKVGFLLIPFTNENSLSEPSNQQVVLTEIFRFLQMQHPIPDLLRPSLIPELRADISAGSACH